MRLRALLPPVLAALAAFALAFWLRYGLVEAKALGLACDAGDESLACGLRAAVIFAFWNWLPGWLALALGLWQLWRPAPWRLAALCAVSALALVLYNSLMGGTALALAGLSLARPRTA